MRKMSNKGFTLIELLAVITIMGILMMVAIPSVTRTIENARRDTFADIASEYVSAVRNAVLADNVICYDNSKWRVASANADGVYFFPICTSATACADIATVAASSSAIGIEGAMATTEIEQSTTDLMESGGTSPFGNADVRGYVKFVKSSTAVDYEYGGGQKTTITYSIVLQDTGKHGLVTEKGVEELTRANINTSTGNDIVNIPTTTFATGSYAVEQVSGVYKTAHTCKMS